MIIVDDCLPPEFFKYFQNTVLDKSILWAFLNSTAYGDENQNDIFDYSWFHMAIDRGVPQSPLAEISEQAFMKICKKLDENPGWLYRARYGLLTAFPERKIHQPHVDYTEQHKTILLYINETDGETILYKNFYDPEGRLDGKTFFEKNVRDKLQVECEIKPVPNRVVMFDGWQYHSSSTPMKHNKRVVLNFNFKN